MLYSMVKPTDKNGLRSASFSKQERLCYKPLIDAVYKNGKNLKVFPFRMVWLEGKLPQQVPAQMLITVPKKQFKKAVSRNRIKRLMREAYRQNKQPLWKHLIKKDTQCAMMLIYIGKGDPNYPDIEHKIIVLLQRLIKEI